MPTPPPHFNIKFIGGVLHTFVDTRDLKGLDPKAIEWVWLVEAKRHATEKEIKLLCAGKDANIPAYREPEE